MTTLSPLMPGDVMGSWLWTLVSDAVLWPRIWSMVYRALAWVLGSSRGVISGELVITHHKDDEYQSTVVITPILSRDHWPLTSCSVEGRAEIAPGLGGWVS